VTFQLLQQKTRQILQGALNPATLLPMIGYQSNTLAPTKSQTLNTISTLHMLVAATRQGWG
jgi:hypothetical protein